MQERHITPMSSVFDPEPKHVKLTITRLIVYGLLLLVLGALAAETPSLYLDLRFLHAARIYNEAAVADAQAKAAAAKQNTDTPVGTIQQSQVHPGPPDAQKK